METLKQQLEFQIAAINTGLTTTRQNIDSKAQNMERVDDKLKQAEEMHRTLEQQVCARGGGGMRTRNADASRKPPRVVRPSDAGAHPARAPADSALAWHACPLCSLMRDGAICDDAVRGVAWDCAEIAHRRLEERRLQRQRRRRLEVPFLPTLRDDIRPGRRRLQSVRQAVR